MQMSTFIFFSRRLRAGRGIVVSALPALCLVAASAAFAQAAPTVPSDREGPTYRPGPSVASHLAQVVFFRGAAPSSAGGGRAAAHVYVDGEFHTALMPNGFTRFCVAKGIHALEAHVGDAPAFAGKAVPKTQALLEGGVTYFVEVSERGMGAPVPFSRADAERVLASSEQQRRFVSRASTVVPCEDAPPAAAAPEKVRFTLNADVLFAFGKGDYQAITPQGRVELKKVADQIRAQSPQSIGPVSVRGHADAIGSIAGNQRLSEQRARSVSRVLAEEGLSSDRIKVEGVGSSEPVVSCPAGGSRQARIDCNSPNRRVEVHAEGMR